MRLTSALITLSAVTLAAAAPASAQEPGVTEIVTLSPSQIRAISEATVTIQGRLTVEFRGDAAAGCAATGVCGLAGSVSWTPPPEGGLTVTEYVRRGRRRFVATLGSSDESVTTSQVTRAGPGGSSGQCADTLRAESGTAVADASPGGAGRISLPGTDGLASLTVDALTTRCAGPLQSDLTGVLPTAPLNRILARRRGVLDLRGRRPFAAHGFAGTVDSTITVRVGRLDREEGPDAGGERVRALTAIYAIERVEGGMATTLAGSADPAACGPLDACGVTGTITSAFGQAREGRLRMTALSSRRPWRDLRAALGLGGRGRRRGVIVSGIAGWEGGPASVTTASIQRPDGGPPCSDSTRLRAALLFMEPARGSRLGAVLLNRPDALRTRCAGPRHTEPAAPDAALSIGRIPIRAFADRRPVVRFGRDVPFTTNAYTGRTRLDLTLHLRRISVIRDTVFG